MKGIIIPILALLLLGCDSSTDIQSYSGNGQSKSVEPKYQSGDKVLSKLGVECVIIRCQIVENEWKLYTARALMTDSNGIMRVQTVSIYEFEIEKKVE